jgi:hypothetical protein
VGKIDAGLAQRAKCLFAKCIIADAAEQPGRHTQAPRQNGEFAALSPLTRTKSLASSVCPVSGGRCGPENPS